MIQPFNRMKSRLDQYLVDKGLCPSREKAKRAILAGQVRVNDQKALKSSDTVTPQDRVELIAPERYVSRGGFKLEEAIAFFQIDVTNKIAVDLGASTGGFTDCLLQQGAHHVYAVDVGKGQLAWKLRQDNRVTAMDQTNARYLKLEHMEKPFAGADLIVADCSFISLRLILPAAQRLAHPGGYIIALIKPQFEAGKAAVDQGRGVIRDPKIHNEVIQRLQHFTIDELHLNWIGHTESPILGPAGNKEFLCAIQNTHAPN